MTFWDRYDYLKQETIDCIYAYLDRNSNSRFLKFFATWFVGNSASLPLFATGQHYNAGGFGDEPKLNYVSQFNSAK